MRTLRWIWMALAFLVGISACTNAPRAPLPAATPTAPSVRQPVATTSALGAAYGLRIGAQWVYETDRSDQCVGRGASKTAHGVITETIVSAWQIGAAQVFELHVESCLFGERLETTEYYVTLDDMLYRTATSPETLVTAGRRGHESVLLLKQPLTIGQAFGASNRGEWRVLDQSPVVWAGRTANRCAHLRRRSPKSEEEIWFCEGLGIVRHVIRHFDQQVNEEDKQLIARTDMVAP